MRSTIAVGGDTVRRNMEFSTREAFSVREFCARYGICRQTFYDEIHRGRISAKKLGKKTVILRVDAEAWAKSLPPIDLMATARKLTPSPARARSCRSAGCGRGDQPRQIAASACSR
jgi:excisionase family DNA binding protein